MEYSRMPRSMQKGEFLSSSSKASTPLGSRPSSGQRRNGGDVSPNELSHGILDLPSFDSELLPEFGMYESASHLGGRGGSFDDSYASFSLKQPTGKVRTLPENNLLKSFSADREKAGSAAKIKVVVDLTEYLEKHEFVFDAVLNEDVSNDEVYRETVEPIVPAIFRRTKTTCFAYGKTENFA